MAIKVKVAETVIKATNGSDAELSSAEVTQLRGFFQTKHGRDTTLSDVDIANVAGLAEGDMSEPEWADAMLAAEAGDNEEPSPEGVTNDKETPQQAQALSHKLAADKTFFAHINRVQTAKEEVLRGPVVIRNDLVRLFGATALRATAIPGTGTKTNPGKPNAPKDRYVYPKPKADGTPGEGVGWFWNDVVDFTPEGKKIIAEIAAIKEKMAKGGGTRISDGKPLSRLESRLNTLRNQTKTAARLEHQIAAFEAYGLEVNLQYDDDKETEPTRTKDQVYYVNPKARAKEWNIVSLNAFLGYDVDKATKAGGTFKNLLDTAKRGTQSGSTTQDAAKVPAIANQDMAQDYIYETAAWGTALTDDKSKEAEFTHLVDRLSKEGSDDYLSAVFKLKFFLDDVVAKVPHANSRYTAIKAKEDAAEEKAEKAGKKAA